MEDEEGFSAVLCEQKPPGCSVWVHKGVPLLKLPKFSFYNEQPWIIPHFFQCLYMSRYMDRYTLSGLKYLHNANLKCSITCVMQTHILTWKLFQTCFKY